MEAALEPATIDAERPESPMNLSSAQSRLNSEQYRQLLVRDGERRFREWHTAFLNYQRQFLQEMKQLRPHPSR
jgi:hypothetical protein